MENETHVDKCAIVRAVLRKYSSADKPVNMTEIIRHIKEWGCSFGRNAIRGAFDKMNIHEVTDEYDYKEQKLENMKKEGEVVYCKNVNGRITGYWIENSITDSELSMLVDMVLSSKILTKEEADSLSERLLLLSGEELDDNSKYRYRISNQPYIGEENGKEKLCNDIVISNVAEKAYIIRKALENNPPKKVEFSLNIYDYKNGKVFMRPYGKRKRICSPLDLIMSNGRYYMLGTDPDTQKMRNLKYKLYRVDLMTDLAINRDNAITRDQVGIKDTDDIFKYRIENPYMFSGETKIVRFRVDKNQFTQVVDWFGKEFRILGDDTDKECWEIEVKVNTNSFIYWVLQYGGCVEVLDSASDNHFRNTVKLELTDILHKYLEGDVKGK